VLGQDVEGDVILGVALNDRAQLVEAVDVGGVGMYGAGQRARLGPYAPVVGLIGVRIFGSDWLVGAVQEGMTPPR
jgi:hypothetical protein